MKLAQPFRAFVCTLLGIALAFGLAAQAAGIALTRKAPETALSLFPLNGLAEEKIATFAFVAAQEGLAADENETSTAEEWARAAYRGEPLSPEAHAILALSEEDENVRSRILSLASNLNRRDPRLQAAILQEQVTTQDYQGAIATLDRILRVRPSRTDELLPALLPVFVREGAVDEFASILDGTSPWHEGFLGRAVKEPAALPNLLKLRKLVNFDDPELDRALLKNLVAEGELENAYSFYTLLVDGDPLRDSSGEIGWESAFPPFDWEFSDRAGFRAQASRDASELEIAVRPGEGGVVARRIIIAPDTPFVLRVKQNGVSPQSLQDIDISLRCGGASGVSLLDRSLARQDGGFEVESLPDSCSFVQIRIKARAWSGRSALNARIDSISIES